MANQIYQDLKQDSQEEQSQNQEPSVLGIGEMTKIIFAVYSLTAPYLIAFVLLFVLALVLILGFFLL